MASVKVFCWHASIIILFAILGVVAGLSTFNSLKSAEESTQAKTLAEAERRIADLKAQNIPVDLESLKTLYESRTSTDDSAAWSAILQQLNSEEFTQRRYRLHPIFNDSPPKTREQALAQLDLQRTVLEQNSDLLLQVHELASHKKPVRLDVDYTKWLSQKDDFLSRLFDRGSDTPWLSLADTHFNTLHGLMHLLTCETLVAVADNNSLLILDSLNTQMSLLSIFGGENLLGDCTNMADIQLIIATNVKLVVESNALNQQQIEQLLKDLQAMPSLVENWQQVVQSERAWLLAHLRGQRLLFYLSRKPGTQMALRASGTDLLEFLDYTERFEKIDWSSKKAAVEAFHKIEYDRDRDLHREPYRTYGYWWVGMRSITRWHDVAKTLATSESERNQAIVGCAIKLYQMKTGVFPSSLDQLVEVGLDSSKYHCSLDLPFGYERQNNTAYLWGPSGYPLALSKTNPKDSQATDRYDSDRWEENLWTLSSVSP